MGRNRRAAAVTAAALFLSSPVRIGRRGGTYTCVGGGRMEKTEPTVRLVFAPEDGPSLRELLLELLRAMREEPER